jgi:hypothetical protein
MTTPTLLRVMTAGWLALAAACSETTAPPTALNTALSGLRGAKVLPPGSHPYGRTYGEWSAAWWRWAYGIPVPVNPLLDETGAQCGSGQDGPVWFLAGVFNASGTAVRDQCVVPSGKALLIPILNAECSNVEGNGSTADEWRACAQGLIDLADAVSADIDGVPVENVARFRVQSPRFGFALPEDNLLQLFGFTAPPGRCLPGQPPCVPYGSVGDGYYVMASPLSVGTHTIHIHGEIPAFSFVLDVTYHLRVSGRNWYSNGASVGHASRD